MSRRIRVQPPITTPMLALAWAILHGPDAQAREAARTLAELILEAGEQDLVQVNR